MALVPLVVLYLYLAVQGYAFLVRRYVSPAWTTAAIVLTAIVCVSTAAWQTRAYFVEPAVKELAFLRAALAQEDLSRYRGIHVIRPGPRDRFVPMQYAAAASHFAWTPEAMVGFVLRGPEFRVSSPPPVTSSAPDEGTLPSELLIIDMREGIVDTGG